MKKKLLNFALFFFFSFLSLLSFGQFCYSNLEGTFMAKTTPLDNSTHTYQHCAGDTWNGIIRWESAGANGEYKVFSLDSTLAIEFEDMSMRTYYKCYQVMDQNTLPNGDLRIHLDSCNQLNIIGTSQWGEVYFIDEHSMDSTATVFTLKWSNDYGEQAEVELTRTDGLLWTDGTTSFSQPKLSKKPLDIFPNPTQDFVYLKSENDLIIAQISIFNIHGKVLLQKTITSPEIDLSSFEKGIYFLEINDLNNGELWIKKLIVE